MSVLDTAKTRFSVRAYTEQAVEEDKLQKILGYSAEPEADKNKHSQTRIPMDELVQYI